MQTRKVRELIIWDGNRLGMSTQRQFHAAVQEIRGQRVMTVTSAALEMVPLMTPDEPDKGRARIVAEIETRQQRARGRSGPDNVLNAQAQLWWLDEWARPDGLYGVRQLQPHERDRYDKLIEHIPLNGFTGAGDRSELRGHVDAQIVCETLAIDGQLLLTHDPNTIHPDMLLPWTQALAREGWISHPKVVEEADEANVRWTEETPEDMLLATIVSAWSKETDAPPTDMQERITQQLSRLALAGLPKTAARLTSIVATTNNLPQLIERTRAALPVQMRNAERRSPYTAWIGAGSPRANQFTMQWTGTKLTLTHQSLNRNVHHWGEWTRNEFEEMERFLAERNIVITGLPAPQTSAGGGFGAAIRATIAQLDRCISR